MFLNRSRGYWIALALMGLIAVVAIGCGGGGESKTVAPKVSVPTATQAAQPAATGVAVAATRGPTATRPAQAAAPTVAAAAPPAPKATQPAQPAATTVVVAPAPAATFTGDAQARLEALVRQEFAGLTNQDLPRLHVFQVRQEPDGGYRVQIEYMSDDVPRAAVESEEILARKRLMEERMQHAFVTLYTSGIQVSNVFIGAKFKLFIPLEVGASKDSFPVLYKTWMTREKAAAVNWQDPALDLRSVWEVMILNPQYR